MQQSDSSSISHKRFTAIVDCNSFYCSCERVFRPDLKTRPVVVLSNNDGCIISISDEAKKLGVHMTGAYYMAKPIIEKHGIEVFSSNYNLYGDMSQRVMETLKAIAGKDKVEVYSVDEAFVDLSEFSPDQLESVGRQIKNTVEMWTGIPVTVGIATSKVLAKVANRLAKKNKQVSRGVMVLDTEEKIINALKETKVDAIWGVGRQYAAKLQEVWGIQTAWQLKNMNEEWARKNLGGVTGVRLIRELRGEPCIEMRDPLEKKKMIASTRMFGKPVTELKDLREAVATYASRAAEKLRRQGCAACSINVFVVINDYEDVYKYNPKTLGDHIVFSTPTSHTNDLISYAMPLVEKLFQQGSRYLKAGVMVGGLVPDESIQGNLFVPVAKNMNRLLMSTVDNINFSMRDDVVKYAASGLKRNWKMRQELRSKRHTSRWEELKEIT